MNLISIPVAVYNGLFEWQLDLFWHRHKELYGKNAFQKAKAIVIRRNTLAEKRCEEFKWNNDVPYSFCESFADYDIDLIKYAKPHPINIQIGLLQILDEFKDDEQIVELLDCDMFHIKEHPVLEIEDDTFFVTDIYENWHLFSLTSKRHIIQKYLKYEELYYNGGFVPIIGKIKTFKKVINTWIEIHKDILGRFPAKEDELTRWWAGMYSFQAACNVEKIKMDIDLILIDQTKYMETLKVLPFSTSWKLYPPRIRLTQHEIFLDNDVVIYKKIPLIDEFLKSKKITFATEAKKRNYGNFDKAIPEKTLINTGLFGLPPYFDIKSKINEILKDGWNNWYD